MFGYLMDRLWISLLAGIMLTGIHAPACSALTIEADQQLAYAYALFKNRQYVKAAQEYQRFTFFFPNHAQTRTAQFRAGQSYFLAKDPGTAISMFQPLTSLDPPDDLSVEAFFKLSECYLTMNAPTHAVVQLNNVIALTNDESVRDRAHYRIGWIHIEMFDWKGARQAFGRLTPNGRERHGLHQLDSALAESASIPRKNPALSGTLSIIPGGGQLYCQRYEDALIAFSLNALFIWAAYDAFDNEQYGLGGLVSFVGLGFYIGNIYGAVNDAHKYNHMQKQQFTNKLLQYQVHQAGPATDSLADKGPIFGLKIPF